MHTIYIHLRCFNTKLFSCNIAMMNAKKTFIIFNKSYIYSDCLMLLQPALQYHREPCVWWYTKLKTRIELEEAQDRLINCLMINKDN